MRLFIGLTALSVCFLILCSDPAFAQTPSTSNSLASLTITVTNSQGELVGGLTRDDFTIVDEKVTRPILAFENADEPMDVGILVDISGSMNSTEVRDIAGRNQIVKSLSTFVQLSNQKNHYFLMAFGNKLHLLSDWTNDIGPSLARIPIASDKAHTAFYDALAASIDKVKTGTQRKRVVLVISDGLDSGSNLKPEEIRKLLKANDVMVYFLAVIGLPTSIGSIHGLPVPLQSLANARLITGGTQALIEFAEITGGRALLVKDDKQMNGLANQIATELRHQYRVEFEPDSGTSRKWRRLKATIKPRANAPKEFRNLKLRVRQGYYSAADGKQ
ncbi:MAG TPA: VWA domain-containing protein [Pyrinomonadaceae bacterium]